MKKIILLTILVLLGLKEADAQIAVIANKSVPIDKINKSKLELIYTLQLAKWNDGTRINPVNIKQKSDLKGDFFKYLGRSSSELKKLWMRLFLTGEAKAPKAVETEQAVLETVAKTPGAIGYINIKNVTPDVKVLMICE